MRFDRSSRSLPNRTYFVEQSLGSLFVATALCKTGRNVIVHNEIFAPDAPDVEWLAALAGSGYVLLSKDGRIRRRPLERAALKAAAINAFFLGNRQLSALQMAQAFVTALPRIESILVAAAAPYWGSVHLDGRVTQIQAGSDIE